MIEIYGQENCSWCTKARLLCDDQNLQYRYFTIGKDVTKQWLLERFPGVKTVPVVVVDNKWIGGFLELKESLNDDVVK